MKPWTYASAGLCALALLHGAPAWADRPMSGDEAAVTDRGSCYVETWLERAGPDRLFTLAPACGVADGMEAGVEFTRPSPRDTVTGGLGLNVKFAPDAWRRKTEWGSVDFALKAIAEFEHRREEGWRSSGQTLLGVASVRLDSGWAWHTNLSASRDRESGTTGTLLSMALVWSPVDAAQVFAEVLTNNRHEVFGNTTRSLGGRWWAVKDRFALDLTTSRQKDGGSPQWSFGIGWYGFGL